jgi:hypothetical protein
MPHLTTGLLELCADRLHVQTLLDFLLRRVGEVNACTLCYRTITTFLSSKYLCDSPSVRKTGSIWSANSVKHTSNSAHYSNMTRIKMKVDYSADGAISFESIITEHEFILKELFQR